MIKKYWKKILIAVLILIISTSISAYAAILKDANNDVSYTKGDGTTVSVKKELDDLYAKAMTPSKVPQVGDVVNYNAHASNAAGAELGTVYSYTSSNSGANGANENTGGTTFATFKSTDAMVWKIMDINNETGAIKLLAANGTPDSLQLKGANGYAYCENILNSISAVYGHGYGATGARSVTVEDINRLTGYNPVANSNGMHTQTYTSGDYFVNLTYTNGKVTGYTRDGTTSRKVTADKYYKYTGTDYLANTTNTYKMLFQNTSGNNRQYWLASRCVYFDSSRCYFYRRGVYDGQVQCVVSCNSDSSGEGDASRPVSPVVSLNSSIQLTWDSTNNRWNLN